MKRPDNGAQPEFFVALAALHSSIDRWLDVRRLA
jgi:hypothetical protein